MFKLAEHAMSVAAAVFLSSLLLAAAALPI